MYIKFGDRSQNRQTEKSKWPINVPRSYIRHFQTVIHRVRNEKKLIFGNKLGNLLHILDGAKYKKEAWRWFLF